MLNTLVHFREVSVYRVDCVECVDNAEFTGILQRSSSEPCRLLKCVDNAEFTGKLQGSSRIPCRLCRVCRKC